MLGASRQMRLPHVEKRALDRFFLEAAECHRAETGAEMRLHPVEIRAVRGGHWRDRTGRRQRKNVVPQRGFQPDPVERAGIRQAGRGVELIGALRCGQNEGGRALKGEQRTLPVTKQTASPSQVMVKRALSREEIYWVIVARKTGLRVSPNTG